MFNHMTITNWTIKQTMVIANLRLNRISISSIFLSPPPLSAGCLDSLFHFTQVAEQVLIETEILAATAFTPRPNGFELACLHLYITKRAQHRSSSNDPCRARPAVANALLLFDADRLIHRLPVPDGSPFLTSVNLVRQLFHSRRHAVASVLNSADTLFKIHFHRTRLHKQDHKPNKHEARIVFTLRLHFLSPPPHSAGILGSLHSTCQLIQTQHRPVVKFR